MGIFDNLRKLKERISGAFRRAIWNLEAATGIDINRDKSIGEPLPLFKKPKDLPRNASVSDIIHAAEDAGKSETEFGRKKADELRKLEEGVAKAYRQRAAIEENINKAEKVISQNKAAVLQQLEKIKQLAGIKDFTGYRYVDIARKLQERGYEITLTIDGKNYIGKEAIEQLFKIKHQLESSEKEIHRIKGLVSGFTAPSTLQLAKYAEIKAFLDQISSEEPLPEVKTGFLVERGAMVAEKILETGNKLGSLAEKPYILASQLPLPEVYRKNLRLAGELAKGIVEGTAMPLAFGTFTAFSTPLFVELSYKAPKVVPRLFVKGLQLQIAGAAKEAVENPVRFAGNIIGSYITSEAAFGLINKLRHRFKLYNTLKGEGIDYKILNGEVKLESPERNLRPGESIEILDISHDYITNTPKGGKLVDAAKMFEMEKYLPQTSKVIVKKSPIYGKVLQELYLDDLYHAEVVPKEAVKAYRKFYGSAGIYKLVEKIKRQEPLGFRITEIELNKNLQPLRLQKHMEFELDIVMPVRGGGRSLPVGGGGGGRLYLKRYKQLMSSGIQQVQFISTMQKAAVLPLAGAIGGAGTAGLLKSLEKLRTLQINIESAASLQKSQVEQLVSSLQTSKLGKLQLNKVKQKLVQVEVNKISQIQNVAQVKAQKILQLSKVGLKKLELEKLDEKALLLKPEALEIKAKRKIRKRGGKAGGMKRNVHTRVYPTPRIDPLYSLFRNTRMSKSQVRAWRKLYEVNPLLAGLIPEALPKKRRRRKK